MLRLVSNLCVPLLHPMCTPYVPSLGGVVYEKCQSFSGVVWMVYGGKIGNLAGVGLLKIWLEDF